MSDDKKPNRVRNVIVACCLSAAGLVGITQNEGFTDHAVVPVPGDVPTYGYGSTTRADGSPVRMGDTITAPQALARAMRDVGKFEGAVKGCVTVPLTQGEYDAYVDLAYNIGPGAFCDSTLVLELNAGRYESACVHIEDFVCGPATEDTRAKPGERCYSKRHAMRVNKGLQNRRAATRAVCEGR
jgi:lysozyme